ncbi:MAG: phosphatidylserine decarboxylase [Bacteriovoracaceae bacterium]|nr:phosphatidylserine decarboxylase [Bacteriovoracaceae bacterium]
MEIKYFNRLTGNEEIEKVYGVGAVRWLYQTSLGKILQKLLCTAPISGFYGVLQDSAFSANKIKPFIKNFNINMDDYLPQDGRSMDDPYSSFNNFFIRRFKDGVRPVESDQNLMPAFSEARYFGYDSMTDEAAIPVKGQYMSAKALLAHDKWESTFAEGPLLLARLCPVDYHRFHYPDSGKVLDHFALHGAFHSVNPIALKERPEIFMINERQVTILDTENFGKLAYIEVGATMVGKIIQSTDLTSFERGQEKGYFLFGGSTVIVLGEKGKWKPSDDLLSNTKKGMETWVPLGQNLAEKL